MLFPPVFKRSQRWQGFEDHSFKQIPQHFLSKKKKLAEKEKARREPSLPKQLHPLEGPLQAESNSPQADLLNMDKQTCSLRTPIGFITSPLPRGRWGSCFLRSHMIMCWQFLWSLLKNFCCFMDSRSCRADSSASYKMSCGSIAQLADECMWCFEHFEFAATALFAFTVHQDVAKWLLFVFGVVRQDQLSASVKLLV